MACEASAAAWQSFQSALDAVMHQYLVQGTPQSDGGASSYAGALVGLCGDGETALRALQHVLQRISAELQAVVLPNFASNLSRCSALATADFTATFPAVLREVASPIRGWQRVVDATVSIINDGAKELEPWGRAQLLTARSNFQQMVAAGVHTAVGKELPGILRRYYAASLAALAPPKDEDTAGVQESDATRPPPPDAVGLAQVLECMAALQVGGMLQKAAAAAVQEHIKSHIAARGEHTFNESVLAECMEMADSLPLHILVLPEPMDDSNQLDRWRQYLHHLVYECVGNLRIGEMFDIVVDYPDSKPALMDLRDCMKHATLHRRLVTRFGQAIRDRLLHPGAATIDIIQQYVSTIQALQHVDPSGAVLDAVSAPIREYLRCRKDTTRCIVTLLTDDEATDGVAASLFAELDAGAAGQRVGDADADFDGPDADAQALLEAERWEPDPIEADPSLRTNTSSDAISLLVGIYGTKELFVSEYRSMLADRLLGKADYDCERELRTLELLKVRFGEASLHAAEVMLRDLAESKRINANVKSVPNTATPLKKRRDLVPIAPLSATIVSQLFWPPLPQEDIKLPAQVNAMLATYAHKYHSLKAPRVLEWKPSLGSVTLDLTIGNRQLEFTVSPFHATVLLQFQAHSQWTQVGLAAALGVPVDALRRKIVYWINQGVVSESVDAVAGVVYYRNDELQGGGGAGDGEAGMEVEEGGAGQAEALEMARLDPFILGMLTNFDSLPLDRIHNMLKMFATDPPYDKTLEQLGAYMARLVTDDKVVVEGGLYKRRA